MVPTTRFTNPIAVEAWDAWFRWREADALRDVTIDATWWRVAEAVAAVEGTQAPLWAYRYVDAFRRWRLLPDERLLSQAGTGTAPTTFDAPAAVLNVAAFVTESVGAAPRFDRAAFVDTAALAVRLLDSAVRTYGATPAPMDLRIGIIGLGDALQKLGIAYAGHVAPQQARTIAAALSEGCLRGAVDLEEERGWLDPDPGAIRHVALWRHRNMPTCLVERASRWGVRHSALTAIDRHPMLACLANNVTDAIDPPPAAVAKGPPDVIRAALHEIGAAMQPWIDVPISDTGSDAAPAPGRTGNAAAGVGHRDPVAMSTSMAGTSLLRGA
ncbi:MAG TPA: hypothetical protein VGD21_10280 [Lysobacter sp.]